LGQAYKICPICDTPNHRNATLCSTCGTTLSHVPLVADDASPNRAGEYDAVHGETDLLEGQLRWRGGTYFLGALATLVVIGCAGIVLFIGTRFMAMVAPPTPLPTASPTGSQVVLPEIYTNTPRPTLMLATVTPGPPTVTRTLTPTITPTQGPCIQEVQPNDSLIAIIARCGHREYANLLQTVLDLNNMSDPNELQIGQDIQVPWPSPTFDPNAFPTETVEAAADGGVAVAAADSGITQTSATGGLRIPPTATLPPSITWHTVRRDENVITIALQYGATLRILSELNPEVTFSQCDFGQGTGGPNCIVLLYEGQQIRVPAPTPTPTIQPTPSGSETATPTVTPTFNVPTALSPSNLAFFRRDDIVTLRWVGTGALGEGESYLVTVTNQTSGQVFQATTGQLSFILPIDWQDAQADRANYSWTVAVIKNDQPDRPLFVTEARVFTWQGKGSSS